MCYVVRKVAGYFQDDPFHAVRQRITRAQNVIEVYSLIYKAVHIKDDTARVMVEKMVEVAVEMVVAVKMTIQQRDVSSSLCDKSVIGSHSYKELLLGLNEDILPCRV